MMAVAEEGPDGNRPVLRREGAGHAARNEGENAL